MFAILDCSGYGIDIMSLLRRDFPLIRDYVARSPPSGHHLATQTVFAHSYLATREELLSSLQPGLLVPSRFIDMCHYGLVSLILVLYT